MRRSILPRLLLGVLVAAAPALAKEPGAPDDQYEQFVSETPTIHDVFTKLEWDRYKVGKNMTYASAGFQCSSVALPPTGRLPTLKELQTILDEQPTAEYEFGQNVPKMIDVSAFPDTAVDLPYWTQTPADPANPNLVWTLDFKTGAMTALDSSSSTAKAHARCVR